MLILRWSLKLNPLSLVPQYVVSVFMKSAAEYLGVSVSVLFPWDNGLRPGLCNGVLSRLTVLLFITA